MIDRRIYDTATLLATIRKAEPPNDYWLSLCFNTELRFDTEYVDLEKAGGLRKIAPLVVPTAQGKPIYSRAARTERFKPAYLKPKDPISLDRILKRAPGLEPLVSPTALTPQARYNAILADMLFEHDAAIRRQWEWQASQAVQFGAVRLEGEGYPAAIVDYGRAAGHTVVLGGGARWGDAGVSILQLIESWRTIVRQAEFGGVTNRLTLGSEAWGKMRVDPEVKELLNTQYRNFGNATLNLGFREGLEVEYVGSLSGTLEVWVYSDYYHAADGTQVPFMSPKDIVLTGPGISGVRCFGAIMDTKAGLQALPIFPKTWDSEDPSATFLMTQSAPLMVPINPNVSFRARVVA